MLIQGTQQEMNNLPRVPGARGYFTPGSQGARFGGSSRAIGDCCGDYLPGLPSFPGPRTVPRFGGRPRDSSHLGLLVGQVYVYILLLTADISILLSIGGV